MRTKDLSHVKEGLIVKVKIDAKDPEATLPIGMIQNLAGTRYFHLRKEDFDGQDYWVPLDWVDVVDLDSVYLKKTADDFYDEALKLPPYDS